MKKKLTTLFFLLSLLLLFPFSSATARGIGGGFSRSSSSSPYGVAEKLIRALNLLPTDAKPVLELSESLATTPKLVERSFKFPNFVGGSNTSVDELGHHAGYYKIKHSHAARLFYFFFESRNSKATDPVVIWLTGGPGCSSELALFYENGPFKITEDLSLQWNDYGWDKISNIIYVDQPTGTGFSYSSDESDIPGDEVGVSNSLYDFLQAFFAEHPQYQKNDFYITGESYAGHYIPAFASRVNQGNKAKEGIHINLKGFAIGNGLTNPAIQYAAYPDYALQMKLINKSDHTTLNEMIPKCEKTITECETKGSDACLNAYAVCTSIFNSILSINRNINYYDIRKQCVGNLCYDFSNMEKFLNDQFVRNALGVGNISFVSCSPNVFSAMQNDWMKNLEIGIPALLKDGIKSLIYAGEYDLICNWLGNSRWVNAMTWYDQKAFIKKPTTTFNVDGFAAGVLKSQGPLVFLKVYNAGHMVPMDQPKASLEMLKRWMQGTLSEGLSNTADILAKQEIQVPEEEHEPGLSNDDDGVTEPAAKTFSNFSLYPRKSNRTKKANKRYKC